jgi:putative modified peptide
MASDLSAAQVDQLLAKLTSDKEFHAQFAADPAAALKALGLPTGLAACLGGKTLASPAAIASAQAGIRSLLVDAKAATQHIHNLAAN